MKDNTPTVETNHNELFQVKFDEIGLDVYHRLNFVAGQIHCACGVGAWCFGMDRTLHFTSCPAEKEFLLFFNLGGCLEYALEHARDCGGPMLLTDALDLLWIADFVYKENYPDLMIVLGPMFNSQSSVQNLESMLRKMNVSLTIRSNLLDKLQLVPVLSYPNIVQYVRLLHYSITGERIDPSAFHYQATEDQPRIRQEYNIPDQQINPERARVTEANLLQMIREGNIHAHSIVDQAAATMTQDSYGTGEPQREAKNTVLIFIALCARAAMEGGLSPKIAKELEVYYIACVEKCTRMSDLINLNSIMLEDFIHRVHRCKEGPELSMPVQECCAYIQSHLEQPLKLEDLAKQAGYTEYYLTKKFRKETGVRLVDYIRNARIERAKILLTTTDISIQDISDRLHFGARTYFTKVFRQVAGTTPAEFRETNGGTAQ